MKHFLLCLLSNSIVVLSCGKQPEVPREFDPWFTPHMEHFKQDADAADVGYGALDTITVFKFDFDENVRARAGNESWSYCNYKTSNGGKIIDKLDLTKIGIPDSMYHVFYKEIVFSEVIKNITTENQYRTFLHEIGHCAYHLSHNPEYYSIMYKNTNNFNSEKWPRMLSDYFKDAKSNQGDWGQEVGPKN